MKLKKNVMSASIFSLSLVLGLNAIPNETFGASNIKVSKASGTYKVNASSLNVRSGNGTKYKKIGSLPKGAKVTVTGKTSNGWYRIKEKTGYVSGTYLKVDNPSSNQSKKNSIKVSKASGKYIVNASTLNVRAGNGTSYKSLGQLKNGAKVNVTGKTSNNWYRISFKGKTGYVSGKYLKADKPSSNQAKPTAVKKDNIKVSNASGKYIVNASTLNVRAGNGTSYKSLGQLKNGAKVNVTGKTSNNWYRISFKGKTGYVSGKYLKVDKPSSNQSKKNSIKVSKASGKYIVNASTLNVRAGNGTSYKSLGQLKNGAKINVTGKTSNNWYCISFKGKTGYVSGSYLKADKPSNNQSKPKPDAIQPTYVNGVLIVNKKHALPSNFAPGESPKARQAFNLMKNDAKKKGFNLIAFSGYRTYSYQKQLYDRYVAQDGQAAADRYSARPGHSEHQTGLVFDIGEVGKESTWFSETPATQWMADNAHKYGFIVRYPKGKEHITGYKYEPWHLRFLGVDLATKVYKSGLTLEEYLGIS